METIEKSFSVFRRHIRVWQVLAIYPSKYKNESSKQIHQGLALLSHIILPVIFPLTMIIAIFQLDNMKDILEDLAMVLTMFMVLVKGICLWYYMDNFLRMEEIASYMDSKLIISDYGVQRLAIFRKRSSKIFIFYAGYYTSCVVIGGLTVLMFTEKRLQFPAYFPFDWESSQILYILLSCYQFFGWTIAVMYNFTVDTYQPILVFALREYLHILSENISLIGYDGRPDPHKLLKEAVEDHKMLQENFNLLNEIMSYGMFGMFFVVATNLVSCILLAIYFADNAAQSAYFMMVFGGYTMQIILPCHYGTEYTSCNEAMKTAIYKCNWMDQSHAFKTDMLIFIQNSLKTKEFVAGGMLPISLVTFMKIMKSSYSLLTVLNHMSKSS